MELAPVLLVLLAQFSACQESVPAPSPKSPLWVLDVADDGSRVAVAREDGTVELWDPLELKPLATLEPALGSAPWELALSPTGRALAALDVSGNVVIWGLAMDSPTAVRGERLLPERRKPDSMPNNAAIAWSPNEAFIALAEPHGQARMCKPTGEVLARWEFTPTDGQARIAWTADSHEIATAAGDRVELRKVGAAEQPKLELSPRILQTPSPVMTFATHPTEALLVTGHGKGKAVLWKSRSGERAFEFQIPPTVFLEYLDVAWAAFSPNGKALALSTREGSNVYLLDVSTGELTWTSEYVGGHFIAPLQVAWSADSSSLWWAFHCCGNSVPGSYAMTSPTPTEVQGGFGPLPRFGGDIGLTITSDEAGNRRVVTVL